MRTRSDPSFIETQRREQIVEAAIAVLAQSGHRGLTFVRIAEEAGISPGLITYHFATKATLIQTLTQTLAERLDRAMAEPASGAESYVDALYAMVTGFARHCAHHSAEMQALSELEQLKTIDPQRRRDDEASELQQMISDGQSAAEFRAGDSRILAQLVLAVMRCLPTELLADPTIDIEDLAHETASAVVHLVANPDRVAVRRRLTALRGAGQTQGSTRR